MDVCRRSYGGGAERGHGLGEAKVENGNVSDDRSKFERPSVRCVQRGLVSGYLYGANSKSARKKNIWDFFKVAYGGFEF
jgi:hypothetical protein